MSADGTEEREVGQVAEVTDLVDLSSWPERTRMLVRSDPANAPLRAQRRDQRSRRACRARQRSRLVVIRRSPGPGQGLLNGLG
jgi:hypothetical protein